MDNLAVEKVVPEVIDTIPQGKLEVNYDSGVSVQYGNELTPTSVKDQPKFKYDSEKNSLYTIVMVDPDAPSRADPKLREILHFLVINVPGSDLDVSKGQILAEYIGSGPPKGTGFHRYIFLVYKQVSGNLKSDMKIPKNSRDGRISFSIRNWAKEHNLELQAANFYQAQYDCYVPILHAQLSGNQPAPSSCEEKN